MAGGQMVLLRVVPSSFHARVLAARLGADGIPAALQGAVDGVYPWGDVRVYVTERDFEVARELLLADEVESAFERPSSPRRRDRRRRIGIPPWLAVSVLFVVWMACSFAWR